MRFQFNCILCVTCGSIADKLIDNGGYNHVYKGLLPSGKRVAVKVLKSSKEACKDFTQEVDVMSSLKHENITPLLGICVEDNELISVYDFLSGGNLEENLHDLSELDRFWVWIVFMTNIGFGLTGLLKDGWEIYANWLISEIGLTAASFCYLQFLPPHMTWMAPSQGRFADPNIMKYTLKVFPVSVFEA
ncbi:hypothetical protein HYC85_016166 [Camellia sinensis]|uniref:Protein kinase domain-containing protein n=1 Tax=Camellia sinensis TaxID=4442 RepID=A0A7J7H2I9_CAMSI|nr:hypothetical protein HYC85_016166 [Camellia sinensis]